MFKCESRERLLANSRRDIVEIHTTEISIHIPIRISINIDRGIEHEKPRLIRAMTRV